MRSSTDRGKSRRHIVFVFLDGVGIGPADARINPFLNARLPTLEAALGNLPTIEAPKQRGPLALGFPLDATLDVPGLPQSGTGQTALLTGENAAVLHGSHFGPWTPVGLRTLLEERNLLRGAQAMGRSVAFGNAYPVGYLSRQGGKRLAAPPLAAASANLLDRHAGHLSRGEAVASEILNTGWRERLGHTEVPRISAEAAGENLARISEDHDLTFFAHYATDRAGHLGEMGAATKALDRVDRFLGGLVSSIAPDTWILVASDHGNIEDVGAGHTRNPALGLLLGDGFDDGHLGDDHSKGVPTSITDIPRFILDSL